MAVGVLPQDEQPCSSLVNDTGHAANMKGNSGRPTPKYTKVGERLRHAIPGHVACSVACGGRACKYENPARWTEQEQALPGLYSSWVTDGILAMARPSTQLLQRHGLLEQFRSHGLRTVINLQRRGEHASCGSPLEPESGFTYLPEAFMEAGVYFYNFGWKDYGVASLITILDMVKVMAFALQEGKVAVHCHAGLGRTGVLIACYLVFATRMTADQAIVFVRAKRPGAIQTHGQLLCVREFAQFLVPLRSVFSCCDPRAHAVTLAQYLTRQRHLLHGYEARVLRHVPKIVHVVCTLLRGFTEDRPAATANTVHTPRRPADSGAATLQLHRQLLTCDTGAPGAPAPASAVGGAGPEEQDGGLASEHTCDPLWTRRHAERLPLPTRLERQLSYSDSDLQRPAPLLEPLGSPWTVPGQAPRTPPLDLSEPAPARRALPFSSQAHVTGLEGLRADGSPASHGKGVPEDIPRSRTFSSGVLGSYSPGEPAAPAHAPVPKDPQCPPPQGPPGGCEAPAGAPHAAALSARGAEERRVLVAQALADLPGFTAQEEVRRKVETWQKDLNSQDGAWERMCEEKDPFVLCSLMWSWVAQLKEPVIGPRDVALLVGRAADAPGALFSLEKGPQQTVLCVLRCVASLRTIPADLEEAVLAQAVRAFTTVNMDSENGPVVYSTLKKIFKHILEEERKTTQDSPDPSVR